MQTSTKFSILSLVLIVLFVLGLFVFGSLTTPLDLGLSGNQGNNSSSTENFSNKINTEYNEKMVNLTQQPVQNLETYQYINSEVKKISEDQNLNSYERLNAKSDFAYSLPPQKLHLDPKISEELVNVYNLFYSIQNDGLKIPQPQRDWLLTKVSIQMTKTYEYYAFMYPEFNQSDWKNDPQLQLLQKKYGNGNLSVLIFLFNKLNQSKDNTKYLFGVKALVNAEIVDSYYSKLTEDDKNYFVKSLATTIADYDKEIDSDLYVKSQSIGIYDAELPLYIAYAANVLSKYDKNVTSQTVDSLFTKLENGVEKLEKSGYSVQVSSIKTWGQFMQIGIYYERYAKDKSKENLQKMNSKIKEFVAHDKNMSGDAIYKSAWGLYFQKLNSDAGTWDNIRLRLIAASKLSPELLEIMKSYGYKPSK